MNNPMDNRIVGPNRADEDLAAMSQTAADMTGIDTTNLAVPRLMLAQGTSSFPGASQNVGRWYNDVLGEFYDSLNLVFVSVHKQRAVFPEPYSVNMPVLCASPDGMKPFEEYVGRNIEGISIFGDCSECPLAQWNDDPATGRGTPPRCSEMFVYTGLDYDTGMPFSMRLKGTGIRSARKLNTMMASFGFGRVLHLSSEQAPGRKYFVPVITRTEALTPPELMAQAQSMLRSVVARQVEESASGDWTTEGGPALRNSPTTVTIPPEDDIPF